MKKIFVLVVLAAGISTNSWLQEKKKETKRITVVDTRKQPKPAKSTSEELKSCKVQLEALDKKEATIRSNPEQLKVANENGWFKQAEESRKKLNARIKELEKK
ncbi:MAG: hypothetical protein MI810_10075 [Flavobacteriales bacterium]|nr:hypothetical protein [Flavobacteriales bacterium]